MPASAASLRARKPHEVALEVEDGPGGRVAELVGFHEHHANTLLLEGGKLTGAVGQLHNRDAVVNNIGSLLDPATTMATSKKKPAPAAPAKK